MLWQLVAAALVVGILVFVEETLHLGDDADTVFSLLTTQRSPPEPRSGRSWRDRWRKRIGRTRLMAIGYLAPLMLVPAGLTPPLPVLFACLFVLGFTDAWAVIAMQTYLAEAVPDAMRGRVYATWIERLPSPGAGFGLVGWLTPRLGPRDTCPGRRPGRVRRAPRSGDHWRHCRDAPSPRLAPDRGRIAPIRLGEPSKAQTPLTSGGRHVLAIRVRHFERAPRRLLERIPALLERVVGLRRQADVDLAAEATARRIAARETNGRIVAGGLAAEIDPRQAAYQGAQNSNQARV